MFNAGAKRAYFGLSARDDQALWSVRAQGLQGVEWSLDLKRMPVGLHLCTEDAHLMRIRLWRLFSRTESKSANWPTRVHSSDDSLR